MSKGAKLIFQLLADLECMRTFAFAIVRLCEGWGMRLGVGWVTLTFGIVCVQSILRWNTSTAIRNFLYNDNVPMTVIFFIGSKFLSAPHVSKGNLHRKAPKWVKNQAKGSKIHKIRTKWHPTYCGNPPILSSELLWESTFYKFGHQPTVGIHQFCPPTFCGNSRNVSRGRRQLHGVQEDLKWKWNFVSVDIFTSGDLAK